MHRYWSVIADHQFGSLAFRKQLTFTGFWLFLDPDNNINTLKVIQDANVCTKAIKLEWHDVNMNSNCEVTTDTASLARSTQAKIRQS